MKSINKVNIIRNLLIVALLLVSVYSMAQGAHPGTDPEGMSTPLDGGILMALLGGAGLLAMYFKKKKKDK